MLTFDKGSSKDGNLFKAYRKQWDWNRNGGSYDSGEDFFSVHYEVKENKLNEVRLHVESPKENDDPELNKIKLNIVNDILAKKDELKSEECVLKVGGQSDENNVKNNKSTTVVKYIFDNTNEISNLIESKKVIENVDKKIGKIIDEIFLHYKDKLLEIGLNYSKKV